MTQMNRPYKIFYTLLIVERVSSAKDG